MIRAPRRSIAARLVLGWALALVPVRAHAEVVPAEPVAPLEIPFPEGEKPIEARILFQLVVDAEGNVESATAMARNPADVPDAFVRAAAEALRRSMFRPSLQDGRAVRSRIAYSVAFHPPPPSEEAETNAEPAAPLRSPGEPVPTPAPPAPEPSAEVIVRGAPWPSPRGIGDIRIDRDVLTASPRQQTSEMLSAAPGFFVDHEDGEGLGNDVFLRGFDLDHGSGIEMRLGEIPINAPLHIQGQGYADANFIIPEVVRSIRVLEGPYDPRQGDSAIVGSAYFDLGAPERGYQLRTMYGSFDQVRVVGIAAPEDADDDTFAAFSFRKTDGFGQNRDGISGSLNAQYGLNLGPHDRVRIVATGYANRSALAGVVREDDVSAKRIGFYDTYPYFANGQSVSSSRFILGATFEHRGPGGAEIVFTPWVTRTGFRARQNFTGDLETGQVDPASAGLGDLYETQNKETAGGFTARFHSARLALGDAFEITGEPGIYLRAGHTEQSKNLLDPNDLQVWDRRIDAGIDSIDVGAYADVDIRVAKRLRLSGGPRADLLSVSIDDRLANIVPAGLAPPGALPGENHGAAGLVAGAHATAGFDLLPELTAEASYGEGFRSLSVERLSDGDAHPYSRIRSVEGGFRASTRQGRHSIRFAAFETWVGNELVFEASSGGLETQNASVRKGLVASLMTRPADWLLGSIAFSATSARFATRVAGVSHYVPNVPPILFRADLTVRKELARVRGIPVSGRLGAGYTLLSGRHLSDTITGPTNHIVNASAALRYDRVELGIESYNVLGLKYADDEQVYVSNWSLQPGQHAASTATHITAAPPRTVLGTLALYF